MSQSKHTEARELMCSGALLFFSHGQQNSAADLSMLVLESLEKAEVEVADELLENLAKLFSLMDPNSPERVAFVSRALKWSSGGSGKLGHPRLHQLLALTLWKEQNYCESRYHFLHSADGEGCAHMLVEYSTSRGFRSEVDMFVAQAVLQFLCLKNKNSASVVFTTYTQKHPSIENGPPFVQPLLNFIWFLLLAVDGGKLTVFTVLCEQYQPSLRRDPMYNEYLDRIGQLFFGVPPKQTSSYGGLLDCLPQRQPRFPSRQPCTGFQFLRVLARVCCCLCLSSGCEGLTVALIHIALTIVRCWRKETQLIVVC
ncbi:Golgi to ER traffic protein 4 homolog isoform X2 [Leptonychotes weddellii]|nr:Golgi to ER traffic protein 4 homolog isoform X2 [Leptonychotes weddellii]XP_030888033.1 Golgi to ER traffic protein 4 homolog isoform X2 [Leptonychotes weddellii]XP_030888034.1 Golgi to ER traffic protein 4 homolog isoform X2 [Leptonychotes weddellii]